jgi:hypothetical protein
MDVPREVRVRLNPLFGCSLKEDLSAGGAYCLEVYYGSYARM